ncbi:MAG: hypothetical protein MUD06_12975, partial [Rhodospirillales bacterium]|nr:hypothetical protein [Rhodospirillales bacterium]
MMAADTGSAAADEAGEALAEGGGAEPAARLDGAVKPVVAGEAAKPAAPRPVPDLRSPELYLNRELTWLQFNYRVLNEARDRRTPLLERVKFLAIASSNMDEFFMKRIGGLKQQIGAGVQKLTVDGRTPGQQLEECRVVMADFRRQQRETYLDLLNDLRRHDIHIRQFARLPKAAQDQIREYYQENVFPLVTPLAMDPAHPFPFISNLSLNLLVTLRFPHEADMTMARIKVPTGAGVPRFLRVAGRDEFGMEIQSVELFRVTRNANTDRDEETADDLVAMIEAELRERKFAPIVRLETIRDMDPNHRGMLAAELGLDAEKEVYDTDVMMGMRDLMEIASLDRPEFRYAAHQAIDN